MFNNGEIVILNENAKKDLPLRVGERCLIIEEYRNTKNFDYYVQFDDLSTSPVKISELNKLTHQNILMMGHIFTGNKVLYKSSGEIVEIVKVDYILEDVEIQFDDSSTMVVRFDKLIEIEDDTIAVLEFDKEEQSTSRTQSHRNVIEEIHNTFKIKNSDYGNSFGEQYDEYGLLSAVIRLDDKMRRLKQLMKQEAQVKDESIRDTVLDLANYAIMTVMELDKN